MATIASITKDMEKLVEQNKKDIEAAETELSKTLEEIGKAETALRQAQTAIDAKAYAKAKSDLWTAERMKEFYTERLHMLKTEPLLEYDEYRATVSEVYKLAEEMEVSYFQKADEHLDKIVELGEQATAERQKVNDLLKVLEGSAKGSDRYKRSPDGATDSKYYNGLFYYPTRSLSILAEQLKDNLAFALK